MSDAQQLSEFIENAFGDRTLFEVNGTAFDKTGSAAVYRKQFAEKLFEENHLYIFLGTDSGLLPKYLLQNGLKSGSVYLFIELPELIETVEKELDLDEESARRILLTSFDKWQEVAVGFEFQNYVYLDNMQFHRSIAAEDLHLDAYQEIGRELQEQLEQIRWLLHAEMGSELFTRRQLENLPENRLSAAVLKSSYIGRTAIILGGGPSLDEAIPWVVENRENLLVIAVSRICRRLLEVNLVPDIIVSIDPNQISYDISKEMLLFHDRTIFIHQHHVSSRLLAQWRGLNFYMGQRFEWNSECEDEIFIARGPTVTNCAIDLALHLGVSRLLLSGVDLCFSKSGYTHAQGSNEHKAGPQLSIGQLWVETNSGEMAESTPDLNFAISNLADQAAAASELNCQIINLGAWAAKVPGVDYSAPADLELESLSEAPLQSLLKSQPPQTDQDCIAHLERMLAELRRAQADVREINRLSREGLKANDGFFGRREGGKGSQKYKGKLDKIEKKLKNGFGDLMPMIKKIGIKSLLKLTQGDDHESWDAKDVDRLGRIYFEAYRDATKRLLDMIDAAVERVLSRLEEYKDEPDFELLIGQWEKDAVSGRVQRWKDFRPQVHIPDAVAERIARLEAQFEADLAEAETLHLARSRAWSSLAPVCGKLKLLFRRGEQANLEHLVGCLDPEKGAEEKALHHLGTGFIAELDGDVDAALEEYRSLIDELIDEQRGKVLEEGLLRVFSLSLERTDSDSALLAAECLASLSTIYLPYYADMLKLTGERARALDVYTDYLEQVREDISVMLKMGAMYLESGVIEGAELMFNAVLEKEPWNQAALHYLNLLEKEQAAQENTAATTENQTGAQGE